MDTRKLSDHDCALLCDHGCAVAQRVSMTLYRRVDGRIDYRQIGTTQVVPNGATVIGDYHPGIGFSDVVAKAAYKELQRQTVADKPAWLVLQVAEGANLAPIVAKLEGMANDDEESPDDEISIPIESGPDPLGDDLGDCGNEAD